MTSGSIATKWTWKSIGGANERRRRSSLADPTRLRTPFAGSALRRPESGSPSVARARGFESHHLRQPRPAYLSSSVLRGSGIRMAFASSPGVASTLKWAHGNAKAPLGAVRPTTSS